MVVSHRHRSIMRIPNIFELSILSIYLHFNWQRCSLSTYISHSSWRPPARRRPAGGGGCSPRAASSPASPAASAQRRIRSSASGDGEAAATSQLLPPWRLERSLWWTTVHCTVHCTLQFALMSAYLQGNVLQKFANKAVTTEKLGFLYNFDFEQLGSSCLDFTV